MKLQNRFRKYWAITLILLGSACSILPKEDISTPLAPLVTPTETIISSTQTDFSEIGLLEVDVLEIPLPEQIATSLMEYSSMAWLGDDLIMMPQYPHRLNPEGLGKLYALKKDDIIQYIEQPDGEPLDITEIAFDDGGLHKTLPGFEGFEGLAFNGDMVFMTIETHNGNPMMGYLVAGSYDAALQQISLDPQTLVELPPQTSFLNASDEALTIYDDRIYTFFEDNGLNQNPKAEAHTFDFNFQLQGTVAFPNIEYRVTDATETQKDGTFWVMNYFYPGDDHLAADEDPLISRYGIGETHKQFDGVERIVEMKIEEGAIRLVDIAPLYLRLNSDGETRNWEGIVRLDEIGFLLVTDSFPRTIFGFVQDLR